MGAESILFVNFSQGKLVFLVLLRADVLLGDLFLFVVLQLFFLVILLLYCLCHSF